MALDHSISIKQYIRQTIIFMAMLIVTVSAAFASTQNLNWDANGNLISGDGFFRVYNSFNQLSKVYQGDDENGVLRFEFTYHPVEERVLIKKVYNESGNLTETVYYVSKELVRTVDESGTSDTTYIYHEGQLVAERQDDGTKLFYHPDHLGSTSLITDSNGDIVEETFYTPFGVILSGGEDSRYDYTGQEYDETLEDYDYDARRYDADIAKFTSADKVIQNAYNPQDLNHYSYVRNNPFVYIDPNGRDAWAIVDYRGGKVLYAPMGHMGMIVGNEEMGYYYFSQESSETGFKSYLGNIQGEYDERILGFDEYGEPERYDSLEEALRIAGELGYDVGKHYPLSRTGDKNVLDYVEGRYQSPQKYQVGSNTCGSFVLDAISSSGQYTMGAFENTMASIPNAYVGYSGGSVRIKTTMSVYKEYIRRQRDKLVDRLMKKISSGKKKGSGKSRSSKK